MSDRTTLLVTLHIYTSSFLIEYKEIWLESGRQYWTTLIYFKVSLKPCTYYLQNYTRREKYPNSLHFGSSNNEPERCFGIALWHAEVCWSVGALLPKLPADLVDKQFDKALKIPRCELLSKKVKADKKVFPLVLNYNPILPDIQNIIRRLIY